MFNVKLCCRDVLPTFIPEKSLLDPEKFKVMISEFLPEASGSFDANERACSKLRQGIYYKVETEQQSKGQDMVIDWSKTEI